MQRDHAEANSQPRRVVEMLFFSALASRFQEEPESHLRCRGIIERHAPISAVPISAVPSSASPLSAVDSVPPSP